MRGPCENNDGTEQSVKSGKSDDWHAVSRAFSIAAELITRRYQKHSAQYKDARRAVLHLGACAPAFRR